MSDTNERNIFLDAIDLPAGDARQDFLDQACGKASPLRSAVEQLLISHDADDNPLDDPRAELVIDEAMFEKLVSRPNSNELSPSPTQDLVGTSIGPYKLMELIGEGGFGLVYVAEQQEPVRRMVALKIIKPGMDSRDVIARFEAERQALAMMEHPHIAKVFDAGVSDDQRLYFVMELVRGVTITEFCDHQRLTLRNRIELFCDVCSAIQHAHQKGVIHRDIKPSNVMVTLHDGKPVVKVIDFGVAKAIGQRLTDKTIYTRFFSMIGTPVYMSPEQAEMSGLDIDTRSDIYSLGVLLYELLTGTTPFERERLDSVGYDEMRRIIREEEPAKPSNRVTTLGQQLTTISSSRGIDPKRLTSSIAGDLDWIVLKSLEKDRSRRYESASAFADDIKRYLREEPVVARAPTSAYRLQKYVKRNRLALMTASMIAAALVIGSVVSLWQASQAITERNQKEIALQDALLAENDATKARQEVEQFAERLKQANVLMASGQAYTNAGQLPSAVEDFSQAIEIQPQYYLVWVQRAQLYTKLNCWEEAAADYAQAAELGSPVDEPSWWGAPQLFWYTNRQKLYRSVTENLLENQLANDSVTWNAARIALVSPDSGISFEQLANACEEKLTSRKRDRDRPLFGRPPHDQDQPPPHLRNGGGPRGGPGGDDRIPRGAEIYITGWAQLRAGKFARAIKLLKRMPMEDRGGPGVDLIHFPLAIAYHKLGDTENATKEFKKGEQVLDRWLSDLAEDPESALPIPWFEFIEAQILHREAATLITGSSPPDDPRIENVRLRNLESLKLGAE